MAKIELDWVRFSCEWVCGGERSAQRIGLSVRRPLVRPAGRVNAREVRTNEGQIVLDASCNSRRHRLAIGNSGRIPRPSATVAQVAKLPVGTHLPGYGQYNAEAKTGHISLVGFLSLFPWTQCAANLWTVRRTQRQPTYSTSLRRWSSSSLSYIARTAG